MASARRSERLSKQASNREASTSRKGLDQERQETSDCYLTADSDEETPQSSARSLGEPYCGPDVWPGSLAEYHGSSVSYCGYCKQKESLSVGRRCYDMQSYRLTAADYQELLDRGWRRSGTYCYKPMNKSTCCPNYPIQCKTTSFELSRSQRKCIDNVNSFLINGKHTSDNQRNKFRLNYVPHGQGCLKMEQLQRHQEQQRPKVKPIEQLKASSKARDKRFVRAFERKAKLYNLTADEAIKMVRDNWIKRARLVPKNLALEDYLYPRVASLEVPEGKTTKFEPKHKLVINMCHVDSNISKKLRKEEHSIVVKYQQVIHKETTRDWSMRRYCDFLVKTPLLLEPLKNFNHLTMTSCSREEEAVCLDAKSRDVFKMQPTASDSSSDFLLVKPPPLPTAFGTYHCSYHLDDKLIGVGVLDVLPKCITTVYFFYDPQYGFLNLGRYSAMVEISMVRQMCQQFSGPPSELAMVNFHVGFYVHECKKMHYKTKFRPSYLLCSNTLQYVPTEICLSKLKDRKYADFAEGPSFIEREGRIHLESILEIPIIASVVPNKLQLVHYLQWLEENLGDHYANLLVNNYLIQYASLVGVNLLPKICLKVNVVHRTLLERYQETCKPGRPHIRPIRQG